MTGIEQHHPGNPANLMLSHSTNKVDNQQNTVKSTADPNQVQSAADGIDFCDLLSWSVNLHNRSELFEWPVPRT